MWHGYERKNSKCCCSYAVSLENPTKTITNFLLKETISIKHVAYSTSDTLALLQQQKINENQNEQIGLVAKCLQITFYEIFVPIICHWFFSSTDPLPIKVMFTWGYYNKSKLRSLAILLQALHVYVAVLLGCLYLASSAFQSLCLGHIDKLCACRITHV